jgi:hypothetical protein
MSSVASSRRAMPRNMRIFAQPKKRKEKTRRKVSAALQFTAV